MRESFGVIELQNLFHSCRKDESVQALWLELRFIDLTLFYIRGWGVAVNNQFLKIFIFFMKSFAAAAVLAAVASSKRYNTSTACYKAPEGELTGHDPTPL